VVGDWPEPRRREFVLRVDYQQALHLSLVARNELDYSTKY
jgi:hypothetical protein